MIDRMIYSIAGVLVAVLMAPAADPWAVAVKAEKPKDVWAVAVKKQCVCEGEPALCTCSVCKCAGGGSCRVNKVMPVAPPVAYKHDCGCPQLQCNCGPLGGCHCAENRIANRVNPVWKKYPDGHALYRGDRQLGWLDKKGVYHPIHNGEWCQPCDPPIPLPTERGEATRFFGSNTAPVCRT